MRDGISDRERALIDAARRDLDRMRAKPAESIAASSLPPPAAPPGVPDTGIVPAKSPDKSAPMPDSPPADSIAMRIAVLMEAERAQKTRRLQNHQRWKTGAIGLFVLLAAWWAVTIIGHLRH